MAPTEWPDSRYRILFWILFIVLAALSAALWCNDKPLLDRGYAKSQELQRVSSPPCARCDAEAWRSGGFTGRVVTGIAIDTFAYVPCYVALFVVCCLWCEKHLADEQLRRAARTFVWGSVLAGAFDLLENGGMLLELRGSYALAPFTAAVSAAKWTIITIVFLFVAAVFLRRRMLFGATAASP